MNSWFLPCFKVVLFFFFFTSLCKTYASSSSPSAISYRDHCASIVPESTPTIRHHDTSVVPFRGGFYTGGDRLLPKKPSNTSFYGVASYVRFRPSRNIYKTDTRGVYRLQAYLYFRLPYYYGNASNSRYGSNYRRADRGRMEFSLSGFWSEVSRKLCMVGSARWQNEEGKSLDLDGVLKLKIASDNSSILTSLVSGSLESIYPPIDSRHFEPVSIYEFPYLSNYRYSFGTGNGQCSGDFGVAKNQSVSLDSSTFCTPFSSGTLSFVLEYPSQCKTSQDCDFLGGRRGYFPMFVRLRLIQCSTDEDEPRIRYVVTFGNSSYVDYYEPFDLTSTLIAEGSWNASENRLCIVACRILNPADQWEREVGDCTTRLSLRYPSVWSIRNNSDMVGHIWTNKTIDGSRNSRKVEFHSWGNSIMVPGLKYEYTKLDRVRKSCTVKKAAKSDGTQYPSGRSYDMRFDMSVKHSKTHFAWGSARPLFVGNEMYEQSSVVISDSIDVSETEAGSGTIIEETNGSVNMSYKLSFGLFSLEQGGWFSSLNRSMDNRGQFEITAEGVYDAETGHLCMIGCRKLSSLTQESSHTSFDCAILVNFEFPPTTGAKRGELIKGSIKSTRKQSDPLYFEDLSVTSNAFYASEAQRSIWRMDLEIMLALISNTFTCIFVGLQLFHVRKNPQVLCYISLVMVLLLSIGHMIPLVLNFEAVFLGNHDKQTLFLSTGRWLEANEVTVRLVTMVAFLLEIRLFQLVWTSRSTHENKKSLWAGENKAALVSVLICIIGGLLMLLVNWMRTRYGYEVSLPPSLWGDLRSYAGLILDVFLLPQILLNVFCSSRESLLSRSFYVGMTVVRALPHGYDLYRGQTSVQYVSEAQTTLRYVNGTSYYYANPSADFYSATWDVIIPCVGFLLAVIIFLQQRLGGRWILPQRFREVELYQKVPVVDNQ